MATTVEDIVNQALDLIGYQRHIGSIYDGSPAARVALDLYYQTRQEQLYQGDWMFARKEATLVASLETPLTPWAEAYDLPSDFVRLRYIKPGPLTAGTRDLDPRPILFEERYMNGKRTLLTDTATATIVYTADVSDPADWDSAFTATVVIELAKKMRGRLAGGGVQQVTEEQDARQQS